MIKWNFGTEKESFIRGHGFNDLSCHGGGAAFHELHELADAGQAGFSRERKQTTIDQILFVGGQIQTGTVLENFAKKFVIGRVHGRPLELGRNGFTGIPPDDAVTSSSMRNGWCWSPDLIAGSARMS